MRQPKPQRRVSFERKYRDTEHEVYASCMTNNLECDRADCVVVWPPSRVRDNYLKLPLRLVSCSWGARDARTLDTSRKASFRLHTASRHHGTKRRVCGGSSERHQGILFNVRLQVPSTRKYRSIRIHSELLGHDARHSGTSSTSPEGITNTTRQGRLRRTFNNPDKTSPIHANLLQNFFTEQCFENPGSVAS